MQGRKRANTASGQMQALRETLLQPVPAPRFVHLEGFLIWQEQGMLTGHPRIREFKNDDDS